MSDEKDTVINKRLLTITVVLAAVAAIAATGLLVNIFEHRQEAKTPFYKTVELSDKIAPREIHHHDIVHFALEELRRDLGAARRQDIMGGLLEHLQKISDRGAPSA